MKNNILIILGLLLIVVCVYLIFTTIKYNTSFTLPTDDELHKKYVKFNNHPLNMSTIPRNIYFTYRDIESIPTHVMGNIKKYCDGYTIKIFDDKMCKDFLERYYGGNAVEIFNNFKSGAHKADFWRYCMLYVFGGYYFDIKTNFQKHIDEIFTDKRPNTWYTVLASSHNKSTIYNGIIATPPRNKILRNAINHILNNKHPTNYLVFCKKLYSLIYEQTSSPLKKGDNKQKNGWNCILLQELCTECKTPKLCDRYNRECKIVNSKDKICFLTRYTDFPWKKK
jgi:mannosyltransferase OCH1-like enzyme